RNPDNCYQSEEEKMRQFAVISLLIACILLGGCVQPRIIDQVALIQASAYDVGKNGKYRGTIGTALYSKSQGERMETYTASAKTVSQINTIINGKTANNLVEGQLDVTLFGKALAKKG